MKSLTADGVRARRSGRALVIPRQGSSYEADVEIDFGQVHTFNGHRLVNGQHSVSVPDQVLPGGSTVVRWLEAQMAA